MDYRVTILNESENRAIYKTTVFATSHMEAKDKAIREYWAYHNQTCTLDRMRERTRVNKPSWGFW